MNSNMGKKIAVGVALTVGAAGAAMAQTASGPDLSSTISVVAIDTASAGIVSVGAVKVVSSVAKWAVNRLVGFFR